MLGAVHPLSCTDVCVLFSGERVQTQMPSTGLQAFFLQGAEPEVINPSVSAMHSSRGLDGNELS